MKILIILLVLAVIGIIVSVVVVGVANRFGGQSTGAVVPVRNLEKNSLEMARILERLSNNEYVYPILPEGEKTKIKKVLENYYGGM